ncbi:MAG TPA: hypothetical protein VMW32_12345 [Bacteroidales bacterium]|nr:hypothetical protein [Bacteroidales bacterium]
MSVYTKRISRNYSVVGISCMEDLKNYVEREFEVFNFSLIQFHPDVILFLVKDFKEDPHSFTKREHYLWYRMITEKIGEETSMMLFRSKKRMLYCLKYVCGCKYFIIRKN